MNHLKRLTSLTVFLFSCVYFCHAAVPKEWVTIKTIAFNSALEQDKYIILFVGMTGCRNCNETSDCMIDPELPFKQILDDNFIVWYSDENNPQRKAENLVYSQEIRNEALSFPFLFIINPSDPEISIASMWVDGRWGKGTVFTNHLLSFLTTDLISGSSLKWYKNEDEVFQLAQQQSKFIFKLVGRGTSNECKAVLKQLEASPLNKILQDNYILWYSEYNSSVLAEAKPLSGEADDLPAKVPYISIIYPGAPDQIVDAVWGYQDVGTLEDFLKSHTVSNETVDSGNKVTVLENVIQISNQVKNEQIRIFSLTGQQVASIRKNESTVTIDTSHFPKGVVIVSGSSGWNRKLLIN